MAYDPVDDVLTMVGYMMSDLPHADGSEPAAQLTRDEVVATLEARTQGEMFILAESLAATAAGLVMVMSDNPREILSKMRESWRDAQNSTGLG